MQSKQQLFEERRAVTAAFTLLELLVVIVIMGLLAAIGLPAIRGMNKSNGITAANRQLLDDINYARQRAMADHTSVYMVFIPPAIIGWTVPTAPALSKQMNNLYGGQYTTYALLSLRSVGEQPGRSTPRYLTGWRNLPSGVYIATNKFGLNGSAPGMVPTFFYNSANRPEFPFPVATNFAATKTDFALPHFGFNYLGQLIYRSNSVDHLVYTQGDGCEPNVHSPGPGQSVVPAQCGRNVCPGGAGRGRNFVRQRLLPELQQHQRPGWFRVAEIRTTRKATTRSISTR